MQQESIILSPGVSLGLRVLAHFALRKKDNTRKIVTIYKSFELLEVFVYNLLYQTLRIFHVYYVIYLLFAKLIETLFLQMGISKF